MGKAPESVDIYLEEGCGRCARGGTPACSALVWAEGLQHLRRIALECGLTETIKWSQPCYMAGNRNVLLVAAFKEYCFLAFFKGDQLSDPEGLLVRAGEHSQEGRQLRFTNAADILRLDPVLKAYILEAITLSESPVPVKKPAPALPYPEELVQIIAENPAFGMAFEALTPGRQRGYLMYFSQPKHAETRRRRVEQCIPKIQEGKGLNDRQLFLKQPPD